MKTAKAYVILSVDSVLDAEKIYEFLDHTYCTPFTDGVSQLSLADTKVERRIIEALIRDMPKDEP